MKQLSHLFIFMIISMSVFSLQAQTYQVGDVIINSDDGTKGVVFYVNPDGSGGWMVAMNDINGYFRWSTQAENITGLNAIPVLVNDTWATLLADKDGYNNTQKIRAMGNSITYPAAYAVDFEHGWYLPSAGQLKRLMNVYAFIKAPLLAHGGTVMNTSRTYWSSTYASDTNAICVVNNGNYYGTELGAFSKNNARNVRAVRSFSTQIAIYDTAITYQWNTGATTPTITVSPDSTTTYTVTATTHFGCSNTAEQTVYLLPVESQDIFDSICAGTAYSDNGFELTTEETALPGTSLHTRNITSGSCSTTLTLHLYKYPTPLSTNIYETACADVGYLFNDTTYFETGDYTHNFTTANGCDSVVTLHLTINPSFTTEFAETACDAYTWNGQTYTTSGDYTQTFTTVGGCDSVITLHLTVNPSFATEFTETACDIYIWGGQNYIASGDYTQIFSSTHGCDSVVTLHLTVNQSAVIHIYDSICQGEAYTENGFNIPTDSTQIPQIIEQALHTPSPQTGCDSTINLHLFVTLVPTIAIISENDTICPDDSITLQASGDVNGIIQNEGTPPPPIAIGDILCTDNTIIKPQTYIGSGKTAKGVVFFVDITGQHGWVVKHTQDSNTYKWSPQGTDIPNIPNINTLDGALSDFNGYANTQNIRAAGDATAYPAAYSVDFAGGWYLPAIGQLNLLYGNLSDVIQTLTLLQNAGVTVDFFPTNYHYWSSSKYGTLYPWIVINNGSMRSTHCYFPDVYVREIRSF